MASRSPRSRITSALDAFRSAPDALGQIDAARRLREAAEELETAAIAGARKGGATWSAIGAVYGLTKQGAQQRFRAPQQPAEPAPKKRRG